MAIYIILFIGFVSIIYLIICSLRQRARSLKDKDISSMREVFNNNRNVEAEEIKRDNVSTRELINNDRNTEMAEIKKALSPLIGKPNDE